MHHNTTTAAATDTAARLLVTASSSHPTLPCTGLERPSASLPHPRRALEQRHLRVLPPPALASTPHQRSIVAVPFQPCASRPSISRGLMRPRPDAAIRPKAWIALCSTSLIQQRSFAVARRSFHFHHKRCFDQRLQAYPTLAFPLPACHLPAAPASIFTFHRYITPGRASYKKERPGSAADASTTYISVHKYCGQPGDIMSSPRAYPSLSHRLGISRVPLANILSYSQRRGGVSLHLHRRRHPCDSGPHHRHPEKDSTRSGDGSWRKGSQCSEGRHTYHVWAIRVNNTVGHRLTFPSPGCYQGADRGALRRHLRLTRRQRPIRKPSP